MRNLPDYRRPNPDGIICGLRMDKMDRLVFCNEPRIRKQKAVRGIPVVILSGEREKMPLAIG